VRALNEAVQGTGCWLRVVKSLDDAAAVTVLLARADDLQSHDPAYREELRQWTGRAPDSPDGIPASAVPSEAPAERGSSYRLRDFDAGREDQGPQWAGEPPRAEHPLVVIIGTADDDAAAWLAAGQALSRLLLTATIRGLAASPMTQALEVEDTRARLTGAPEARNPQLVRPKLFDRRPAVRPAEESGMKRVAQPSPLTADQQARSFRDHHANMDKNAIDRPALEQRLEAAGVVEVVSARDVRAHLDSFARLHLTR
jgi:hypothetical protein